MRIHVFIVAAVVIVLGVVIALSLPAKESTAAGMGPDQPKEISQNAGERRAEMLKWAAKWD